MRLFQRLLLLPLLPLVTLGPIAAHRAYYQVRALELDVPRRLTPGSSIQAMAVSSGRVAVRVVVELVQGDHSETLAESRVPANRWRLWDPRSVDYSLSLIVSGERLTRFTSGAAIVRAVGHGAPQWLRVPPPVVREVQVTLQP